MKNENETDTDRLVAIFKWTAITLFGLIVLDKVIAFSIFLWGIL